MIQLHQRGLVNEVPEIGSHQHLACCWNIAEAKEHNCELPQPLTSRECCLISVEHGNLSILALQLWLQIPLGVSERSQGVVSPWWWGAVLCNVIQPLVAHVEQNVSVLLSDEHDG
jgi:hypothetical protein